ncbi:SMI1/KNR4 family protein [Exiguobacterium profundum]|uniref:SMI1/KNR4 family protein n=1 Tax=Exiguobacterium profundum TaxID=307643 RepID=UPI0033944C6B
MEWVLVKPLKSEQLIQDFEEKHDIEFPRSYKDIVKEHNNGRPRPNVFDTQDSKQRVAKSLLSFDPEAKESIWGTYDTMSDRLPADTFPFMIDQFGNYVCFYYDPLKEEPTIVFWDEELQKSEKISDTFTLFLDAFYEL